MKAERSGQFVLTGVVHLLALPGSPTKSPGLSTVLQRALADARALAAGGVDQVIVENFGDAPFDQGAVSPATVAAMTRIAAAVRDALPDRVALGINVLRNDALAALGVAAAVGAAFIRVNVHVGAMVTDQGLIQGRARDTLLERRRLGSDIRIVADVLVKHAVPLGDWDVTEAARDTAYRGHADVLVVTGAGTGRPTDPARVAAVRDAVPDRPLWLGSGLTPATAGAVGAVDGAIVGTWFHADGDLTAPIDPERVRDLRKALA